MIDVVWQIVEALPVIVMVCSAVTASTPTPKDDVIWAKIYKWIDIFALNIGRAKEVSKSSKDM